MSKNIQELPLTEMTERIVSLGGLGENTRDKIRGVIGDAYINEVTNKFDWNFLFTTSSIVTQAEKKTGTVTINTGDTTVLFAGASLDAGDTGKKIKISGNDVVYDFTFVNSTTGTINPSFEGNANASGNGFSIFQPLYALAGDFDRFPKNGGVYKWSGGKKAVLSEQSFQEYIEDFSASPTANPENVRIVGTDTAGKPLVEFRPAPLEKRVYGYDYLRKLRPLIEESNGTVTVAAQAVQFTGNSTLFANTTTGDFIRIDNFGVNQDSTWYRITSIVNDTTLTISQAFANSGVTSANYVISRAPEIPAKLHMAVFYGALRTLALERNDDAIEYYNNKMAEVMSDGKRLFVTRNYSQKISHIGEDWQYRR